MGKEMFAGIVDICDRATGRKIYQTEICLEDTRENAEKSAEEYIKIYGLNFVKSAPAHIAMYADNPRVVSRMVAPKLEIGDVSIEGVIRVQSLDDEYIGGPYLTANGQTMFEALAELMDVDPAEIATGAEVSCQGDSSYTVGRYRVTFERLED